MIQSPPRPWYHVTLLAALAALLLTASSGFAITLSQLQNDINATINGSHSDVQWSVKIEDEPGTGSFYSKNPTTMRRPASNTKIFTTAAAFLKYGPSHVWKSYALGSSSDSSPVHYILTNSNNTHADDLWSYVGGESACLTQIAKITSTSGMQINDGSGLNYDNRFNCEQTIDVLRHMVNNYSYSQWAKHLAISCTTGTLGSRLCGTGETGRVHAKTGTLTNGETLSLSGYVDNIYDGKRYYFSIYCNNVPSTYQSGTRARIDTIVGYMCQSGLPSLGTEVIVDNGASAYSEAGSWANSSGAGYYGSVSRWASVGGSHTATWQPSLSAGRWEVYAWWVASSNRATSARYQITHASGVANINANQSINGSKWNLLGTWDFSDGTAGKAQLVASLSSGGSVVSADAIRFRYIGPSEVIVDNTSSGFSASSNWWASSSTSGYWGSNYVVRSTESVSDAATWSANLTSSGNHEVFVRYTSGSNRATAAPYIVYHSSGSTTISVNQQVNGGTWVSLGTFSMNSGTSTRVALSCWTSSGTYVIGDAIKIVKK